MADVNYLILEGRLVKDAEISDKNGTKVSRFSLAVNGFRKGADGVYDSKVDFFNTAIFGSYAEKMTPYLTKGRKVTILGYLSQDRYEKDGKTNSQTAIRVKEINLGAMPVTGKNSEHAEDEVEPYVGPEITPDMYVEGYGD
ncbi:MAG: single-stranded DNA-binding protein [Treponemataceae bacterium]|nr:single-stranded DNA-binding protein [Treponemataceae bacterium]